MKTVRRTINKNIKMILIVAAVTAVALAVLLMLISGNEERSQVPAAPSETSEESKEAQQAEEETTAQTEAAGVTQAAQALFDSKVESIDDSAGVAKLLETIDLKKNVASYTVEIQVKEAPNTLTVTFDKTVIETDKTAFDDKMQKYAQQILALIPDVETVQWVYELKPDGKKSQEETVYHDTKNATEKLKTNIKKYGESAKAVQTLLDQQKGF